MESTIELDLWWCSPIGNVSSTSVVDDGTKSTIGCGWVVDRNSDMLSVILVSKLLNYQIFYHKKMYKGVRGNFLFISSPRFYKVGR